MERNKEELIQKIAEKKVTLGTIRKQAESGYEPYLADAISDLANLQYAAGQYTEAEANYKEAYYIYGTLGGNAYDRLNVHEYLPFAAMMLDKIAEIQIKLGRYKEADESYKKELACWEECEKDYPNMPEIEKTKNKIAQLQSYNHDGS